MENQWLRHHHQVAFIDCLRTGSCVDILKVHPRGLQRLLQTEFGKGGGQRVGQSGWLPRLRYCPLVSGVQNSNLVYPCLYLTLHSHTRELLFIGVIVPCIIQARGGTGRNYVCCNNRYGQGPGKIRMYGHPPFHN